MRTPLVTEQWLYQVLSSKLGAKVYSLLPHRPILPYVQFTEIITEPWLIKPPTELITIYLEIHSEQTSNVEVLRLMSAVNSILRSHKPESSIRTDVIDTHAFHDHDRWTAGMKIKFYNYIKE